MGALDDLLSKAPEKLVGQPKPGRQLAGNALDQLLSQAPATPPSFGRQVLSSLVEEVARRAQGQPGPIQRGAEQFIAKHRLEPTIGGFVGGFVGGVPGAGLGAGAGEAFARLRERAPGGMEAAKAIGKQAAFGGLGEALGLGAGKALGALGREAGLADEIKNILPTNLKQFFGIPQKSAEALVEAPRATIQAAKAGLKATAKAASESVAKARNELPTLISSANQEYGQILQAMVSRTKGQTVVPTNQILVKVEEALPQYGFDPRIKSVDPMGLSKIKTILTNIDTLKNKLTGNLPVLGYNKIRVQINAAMGNPRISNQAREVLGIMKTELDEALKGSVGNDLANSFTGTIERNQRARELLTKLGPTLNGKNAPTAVANAIEAGDETGQLLEEFEALSGTKFLEPIRVSVRAKPFSQNIPITATEGGAGALAMRGPAAIVSSVPFLGRMFRPPAIAQATAALLDPTRMQRELLFRRPVQAIAQRAGDGLFGDRR